MKRIARLLLPAVIIAFTSGYAAAQSNLSAKGRSLLEANCGRCHAVGVRGPSTHAKAPPFRDVARKYAPESLAESLAEGIVSGHPDMPEFVFQPAQIDAIVAYLNSLAANRSR